MSELFEPTHLPSHIDGVLHLAQSHAYRDFPAGAVDMFRVNVASTASLLEYARRAGASRFYLASTGSVYEPYTRGMAELIEAIKALD